MPTKVAYIRDNRIVCIEDIGSEEVAVLDKKPDGSIHGSHYRREDIPALCFALLDCTPEGQRIRDALAALEGGRKAKE